MAVFGGAGVWRRCSAEAGAESGHSTLRDTDSRLEEEKLFYFSGAYTCGVPPPPIPTSQKAPQTPKKRKSGASRARNVGSSSIVVVG